MDRRTFVSGLACACFLLKSPSQAQVGEQTLAQFLRCGTPEPTVSTTSRLVEASRILIARQADLIGEISVPVHVHVIHDGTKGKVTEKQIHEQIRVLNDAYKVAQIKFVKPVIQFVNKPEWYNLTTRSLSPFSVGNNEEYDMKARLIKQPLSSLNIYLVSCSKTALGWATFPWDLPLNKVLDGIVIDNETLPGGKRNRFNMGHTATHEVGHWLGLFHTFTGGCEEPGDAVDDTPSQSGSTSGCPDPKNSCPGKGGNDPVNNYMNYSDDACMNTFSVQQIARMRAFITLWRPQLAPSGVVTTVFSNDTLKKELNQALGGRRD